MPRLFDTHNIRKEIKINPIWNFYSDRFDEITQMPVPSCWETHPKLASYRGKAVYVQKVNFNGNARLIFKGVSHTAKVWFDDVMLGSHYGAYGEFSYVLKSIIDGEHTIKVEADNSFSDSSALHVANDYYSYGGITRPVILEQLDEVYIKRMHFTPFLKDSIWNAKISILIENITDFKKELSADIFIDNKNVLSIENIKINESGNILIEKEIAFRDVQDYTILNPKLYYLSVIVYENGKAVDDLIDRVGFREIKVHRSDILFNGEKLKLKGFNRHEDYAEFGCAVPLQLMYRDMELIKSTGANCVRTSHYPNDERWLDLCDENGILVWEESHARSLTEEQMKNKYFDEQSELCINEMIENHYNHPSIFIWGLLNECASFSDYGRRCYIKQINQIKSLDSSRLITSASCYFGSDKCLDLVDIVSFNIYPNWYFNEPTSEHLSRLKEWISTAGGKGKPLIISEIGAGAVYGFRSSNKAKWTEELQESILREQLSAILGDNDCSGVFIWQFSDCRVDNESFYARPKSQNNKGILDIYRREKLAFKAVCDIFKSN